VDGIRFLLFFSLVFFFFSFPSLKKEISEKRMIINFSSHFLHLLSQFCLVLFFYTIFLSIFTETASSRESSRVSGAGREAGHERVDRAEQTAGGGGRAKEGGLGCPTDRFECTRADRGGQAVRAGAGSLGCGRWKGGSVVKRDCETVGEACGEAE
jgi:hypothetical protein